MGQKPPFVLLVRAVVAGAEGELGAGMPTPIRPAASECFVVRLPPSICRRY